MRLPVTEWSSSGHQNGVRVVGWDRSGPYVFDTRLEIDLHNIARHDGQETHSPSIEPPRAITGSEVRAFEVTEESRVHVPPLGGTPSWRGPVAGDNLRQFNVMGFTGSLYRCAKCWHRGRAMEREPHTFYSLTEYTMHVLAHHTPP